MSESDLKSDAKMSYDVIMKEEEKWFDEESAKWVKIIKPEYMIEHEEEDEHVTLLIDKPLGKEEDVEDETKVDEDKEAA